MEYITGENGDGLSTLGFRKLADGTFGIKAVYTEIEGEPPYIRKAGMGGARYIRHCLESAVLNRGGKWLPDTIEQAISALEKIDGALLHDISVERWVYRAESDDKVSLLAGPRTRVIAKHRNPMIIRQRSTVDGTIGRSALLPRQMCGGVWKGPTHPMTFILSPTIPVMVRILSRCATARRQKYA